MPACRSAYKGILRTKKALHGPVPHPKPQALPFLFFKGVPDVGIEAGGRRGVDGGRGAGTKAEHDKGCMPRVAGALQVRGEWEGKTEPEPPRRLQGTGRRALFRKLLTLSLRAENLEVTGEISTFHLPSEMEGGFCFGLRSPWLICKVTEKWISPGFFPLDGSQGP